jgi:DNA-binding MarR family transcriptional regulator
MQLAPIPFDEAQRLDALQCLNILDAESEERFDRIVNIAQRLFDVPIAFIALVDDKRVWFKSKYNYNACEGPRDISFCGHAICNVVTDDATSRLFEVVNAENDERFIDNPYVTKVKGIRYYMAFILRSKDNYNIGTLCIVDSRPRTLSAADKKVFLDLGFIAEIELINNRYIPRLGVSNDHNLVNNDASSTQGYADKLTNLSTKLQLLQKQFNTYFKPQGVNYKEWCILNEIIHAEFASPHLICQKLEISPPMMTRKLEVLEIKRLIERWNSKGGDRRFVQLNCTKQGKKIWQKGIDQVNRLTRLYLEDVV